MLVERPTPAGTQQVATWFGYYDELPSWTWDVPVGQTMIIHVYTSGDSVALRLNGQLIGTKTLTDADKRVATFSVPYAAGELTATASLKGREIGRKTLATTGQPAGLRLTTDVDSLTTDPDALAHVRVEVIDSRGRPVPDAVVKVSFGSNGAGKIIGVANGNPHNVDSFKRLQHYTWHGKALAVVQASKTPGQLVLTATAQRLEPASLTLRVDDVTFRH
jgi:beta-galactosidase